jgi:hypothetical protein
MLNFPERKDENLREDIVKLVNTELKVHISPSDVQAIHRIPGKDRGIRPVIIQRQYIDLYSSNSFYLHFNLNIQIHTCSYLFFLNFSSILSKISNLILEPSALIL